MRQLKIANYLSQKVPALVVGKTLFVNTMPAECKLGALIKEGYGGAKIDPQTKVRRAPFHIVVRGQRQEQSYDLAEKISKALDVQTEFVLDDMRVNSLRPVTEPIPFPNSAGDNVEYAVNFIMTYVILSK